MAKKHEQFTLIPLIQQTLSESRQLSCLAFIIMAFYFAYLQLNDVRLDCVAHDVAVNEFRKADETVSLLVEKNAEAQFRVSYHLQN